MPTPLQVATKTGPKEGDWPVYRLFGVTFASDFVFANRLAPTAAVPDIRFINPALLTKPGNPPALPGD